MHGVMSVDGMDEGGRKSLLEKETMHTTIYSVHPRAQGTVRKSHISVFRIRGKRERYADTVK